MVSSIFLIEIITAVMLNPNGSVTDTAAVSCNGIKTILANDVSTFFTNGKAVVINGRMKLKKSSLLTRNFSSSSF